MLAQRSVVSAPSSPTERVSREVAGKPRVVLEAPPRKSCLSQTKWAWVAPLKLPVVFRVMPSSVATSLPPRSRTPAKAMEGAFYVSWSESVGEFGFGKVTKVVIQDELQDLKGSMSVTAR